MTAIPKDIEGLSKTEHNFEGKSPSPAAGSILNADLASMVASASVTVPGLNGLVTGDAADLALQRHQRAAESGLFTPPASQPQQPQGVHARGMRCRHSSGRTVVITRVNAQYSKSGSPMHEVVDVNSGDKLILRAKNLTII